MVPAIIVKLNASRSISFLLEVNMTACTLWLMGQRKWTMLLDPASGLQIENWSIHDYFDF